MRRLKLKPQHPSIMADNRKRGPGARAEAAQLPTKRHKRLAHATPEEVNELISSLAAASVPKVVILVAVLVICSGLMPCERSLRCVELFAGAGAITRAMQQQQWPAAAVDLRYGQPHDMSTPAGMAPAAQGCRRGNSAVQAARVNSIETDTSAAMR